MHHVLIIDRNPSLAEALAAQLSLPNSLHCTGQGAEDPLGSILAVDPDLVILDPNDIEGDLGAFCQTLDPDHQRPKLLAYSFSVSKDVIQQTMASGFHGCMSKYSDMQQLEIAVAAVLAGGIYFDPRFAQLMWPGQNEFTKEVLSTREKEVLIRMAKGLANKQIAVDLAISAKTVETYKARAVQKLGLSDRSKVFTYALEQGWIGQGRDANQP